MIMFLLGMVYATVVTIFSIALFLFTVAATALVLWVSIKRLINILLGLGQEGTFKGDLIKTYKAITDF